MPKMFYVLGFWTGIMGVMAMVGGMWPVALLLYGSTVFFVAVGLLNLSERLYIYIFGAYLALFFVGFTYWSAFIMVPGGAE